MVGELQRQSRTTLACTPSVKGALEVGKLLRDALKRGCDELLASFPLCVSPSHAC